MTDKDDRKGSNDSGKTREQPLEKSINHQERGTRDFEYTREDRQIVRDELPPVYPDDESGE